MNHRSFLPLIESHFNQLAATSRSGWASNALDMWPSVVDTRIGCYPEGAHTPKRVYRDIGAPRGSTLYWDQPSVVAADALADLTGVAEYRDAAQRYVRAFLRHSIDPRGLFQWGNHQYFDVFAGEVVCFHGGPHELRPITPAWELFWQQAPDATAHYIQTMTARHVYDATTGAFNRHDNSERGLAFLEAGAILVESAAWLHSKTSDTAILDLAKRIADYSYKHRNPHTGLIPNEPDGGRWDSRVCTTEVGLWAQSLLRAATYAPDSAFAGMACEAVRAYLRYGYDAEAKQYFGQINIADGSHALADAPGYWPGTYADVWNTNQWPTHDYPMAVAEACLTLHGMTNDDVFAEGVRRWVQVVTAHSGKDAYAESYGRGIHLLARAAAHFNDDAIRDQAYTLADEAVSRLYVDGMFQGYPGSHLYESVDGVGYLLLSLMSLETGRDVAMHGFGF